MQFRQQSDTPLKTGLFPAALGLLGMVYGPVAFADAASPTETTVSPMDLGSWQEQAFVGHTQYRAEDGGKGLALHATADASASALCHDVDVDLRAAPIARWDWRLDRPPPRGDERGHAGDDQGLRISFLHRGGTALSSILAIQYVWSQSELAGAQWANAFVPNAHEVAARSGPAMPGLWKQERRDLQADFRAAFGREIDRVDAVCIMTDGDQTGALVEGWYGDITLQAR